MVKEKGAFMRLQLEVIKISDDESIFAWSTPTLDLRHSSGETGMLREFERGHGMLATWPSYFAKSGDITPLNIMTRPPYSMAHKGLEFCVLSRLLSRGQIPLHCWRKGANDFAGITIQLERIGNLWQRVNCSTLGQRLDKPSREDNNEFETIYIHQDGLRLNTHKWLDARC